MLKFLKTVYERVPDEHSRAVFWWAAAAALIPAGVMGYLFAQLDWYWQTLGWAGVAVAGLVAWVMVAFGFAEYQRAALLSERRKRNELQLHRKSTENDTESVYEGSHEKLMNFVVEHLLSTCDAREFLNAEIIGALCPNGIIAELAAIGAQHHSGTLDYTAGQDVLSRLCDSPPEFIPFDLMIDSVAKVEKGYREFLREADRIAQSGYIRPEAQPAIAKRWEQWRVDHNAMVSAYEPIKRDSKMGTLFRPVRESWFGGHVEAPPIGVIPLRLLLLAPERKRPL